MPMPPEEWQEKLERHFAELAASRADKELPVFALEHGLSEPELKEIGDHLRHRIARGLPTRPFWLLWAIYATEIGYLYDGRDYWPPFEERTPHWRTNGNPALIRGWFRRFHENFNGVVPSGPWATHFNRIAWPITHSILPRLLQRQFSRALLEVSRDVARTGNLDAVSAGRMLARYGWGYSSRFQEFLQQEELAGRIMLALLHRDATDDREAIYPATLERIVADIVKMRDAGAWLNEARRIVHNRFYGVDRTRPLEPVEWEEPSTGPARPKKEAVSIRPRISLRRAGISEWSAIIEIPGFSEVAQLSKEVSNFLKTTRCRIPSVGPSYLPPGWLLYGTQTRKLAVWPDANVPLLAFEKTQPVIDNLLAKEARFSPGPSWTFRVGGDGQGSEILSGAVHPSMSYIVVRANVDSCSLRFAKPINLGFSNVTAFHLEIPEYLSKEDERELQKWGLHLAKAIKIWPSGLNVRNWDGEGHGDWLTTETPVFGVVHDHAVDEYYIRLNNGVETKFEGVRAKEPIFISLPSMSPGRHIMSVRAHRIGLAPGVTSDLRGRIEIRVRDPIHWKPGTTQNSGLYVSIDPHEPTLDALWESGVSLTVQGPEGRTVICALSLSDKNGATIFNDEIGKFDLPMKATSWRQKLSEFTSAPVRAWKYLDASSGVLSISCEELGDFRLKLERELKPLRWVCTATTHETKVKLVDDSDSETEPVLEFYSFHRPGTASPIPNDQAKELIVQDPGGLYVGSKESYRDCLVVSSTRPSHGFASLIVVPNVSELAGESAAKILDLIELWQPARLAGGLPDIRRARVVDGLQSTLIGAMCGKQWASAEQSFLAHPRSEYELNKLKNAVGGHRSLPAVLLTRPEILGRDLSEISNWFSDVAGRYKICTNGQLAEFALKFAFEFPKLLADRPASFQESFANLEKSPEILRAARFLLLSRHLQSASQSTAGGVQ